MATTNYLWDFASDNVLMETDENGATTAVYTNEPGRFGKLISQRQNGQTYYHHYDAQGSTRTVTDQSQNVVEAATYSAFGETVAKTSSITNPFGFKGVLGYYANPEADNLYVRSRILQPRLARWLSTDPIDDWDSSTRYEYALNNPIGHSDASGQSVVDPKILIGGGVAIAIAYCYRCDPPGSFDWITFSEAISLQALKREIVDKLSNSNCSQCGSDCRSDFIVPTLWEV